MSRFTPTFSHVVEFDGDKVRFKLRRLKRKQMQALAPHIHVEDGGAARVSFADSMEMLNVAGEVLPDCIEVMDGLTDAEGRQISVEDVLDEAYFIPLVTDVLKVLFETGKLSEPEAKNSVALSPAPAREGAAQD